MKKLWLSRKTGYRRVGTSLLELQNIFSTRITAQAIYEPLYACIGDQDGLKVKRMMKHLDFDVLGIKLAGDSPIIGYVAQTELTRGPSSQFKKDFQVGDLISESTSLSKVLFLLRDRQRLFVLAENIVHGIITRADLQKPPIRIMLFGFVTLLEMHMSYWVRKYYPKCKFKGVLSTKRLRDAETKMEERRKRKEELDLVDCLQMCDKKMLILRDKRGMNLFGFDTNVAGNRVLDSIERLRNKLAHSQDIVRGSKWEGIIDCASALISLIEKSEKKLSD